VTYTDTQIHAQHSSRCKLGVLYEVPASMHNSSTSESTEEGEVGLLVIPVNNKVIPHQVYDEVCSYKCEWHRR